MKLVKVQINDGWAIGATAAETIILTKVVKIDGATPHAYVGTAATQDQCIGVAIGGNYSSSAIAETTITSGNRVTIGTKGKYRVLAGGTIAAGESVSAGNNGTVIATVIGTTKQLGVATEGTTSGNYIKIIL